MKWKGRGSRVPRSERQWREKNLQTNSNTKMEKQKLFTLLYILLIVVVIITCICVVVYLRGESLSCLADPIQYYSEKTSQMCYCNDGMGWLRG
jgi:hypothetical protein